MKAKEIINEIGVGKIPGLDEPLLGFGGGGAGGGGAGGGIPVAIGTAAAAARSARQAQATQVARSQMAANPPAAAAPATSGYTQTPSGQTGALGTATTGAPGARINSGSPNQPLNVPIQHGWRDAGGRARYDRPGDNYSPTIDDYLIKSIKPNQPLNPPGQNVWRSGQTGAPMRSPGGDRAADPRSMTPAEFDRYLNPPSTPGEKYITPVALGSTAAIGVPLFTAGGDKGAKPASGQSTPQAPERDPDMTQQMQDRLGITLNSQGRTASGATPAHTPTATTTPPAARPAGPQQGVVGSELARLSGGEFASRADRLNQARVNDILGPGYKAGSAAANRALRDYYKANPPMSTPTLPAPELRGAGTGPYGAGPDKGNLSASGAWHGSEMWGDEQLHKGSKNPSADSIDTKESIERLMKLSGQR